jgi:hypothetical protein
VDKMLSKEKSIACLEAFQQAMAPGCLEGVLKVGEGLWYVKPNSPRTTKQFLLLTPPE